MDEYVAHYDIFLQHIIEEYILLDFQPFIQKIKINNVINK